MEKQYFFPSEDLVKKHMGFEFMCENIYFHTYMEFRCADGIGRMYARCVDENRIKEFFLQQTSGGRKLYVHERAKYMRRGEIAIVCGVVSRLFFSNFLLWGTSEEHEKMFVEARLKGIKDPFQYVQNHFMQPQ